MKNEKTNKYSAIINNPCWHWRFARFFVCKKSRGYDFSAFDPDFEEHRNKKKKKSNDAPANKKKKVKERKKPLKNRKDINRKHGRK